ncbi:MAG: AraC family ligand binding domain-containing protein [Bacilli bacterium]|nr:AraC family ligand binding domain-containing protein [Bacilli bacterium]MDD4282201.1 AraC family ligand binding domain-containing protein [Bacilli bacterium]MDD4718200.1 AraC family ligand binding domain-containing protein [Bacilli bacterium]
MKIVKREAASVHKNTENSISIEYDTKDNDINIAFVEISGRYPDNGKIINRKCKELIYVIDGTGTIFVENERFDIKKEDVILIEPNEKYYFEGTLKMLPACYPAWTIEQVEFIHEE